jgi:hypothetical protein
MSTAYVPYNGTAGWSGTDTSKARAVDNIITRKEETNQQKALALLKQYPQGLTWKDVAIANKWHHGTASGVLSVLHKVGAIIRSTEVRDRCKVYYHPNHADSVIAEVQGSKPKTCTNCGHDI